MLGREPRAAAGTILSQSPRNRGSPRHPIRLPKQWSSQAPRLTFTDGGTALLVAGRSLPIAIDRLDFATGRRTGLR